MAENSSRGRQQRESGRVSSNDDSSSEDDRTKDPDYQLIRLSSRRHYSNLNPPPIRDTNQEPAQHTTSEPAVPNVRRKRHRSASENCDETTPEASRVRLRCRRNISRPLSSLKPATILSWLIDSKTVEENGEVMDDGNIEKKGKIKREGILCRCCTKTLTPQEFHAHAHAGGTSSYQERYYDRILVAAGSSRKSMLSCMDEALRDPSERKNRETKFISAEDRHDAGCIVCAIGGDLLCCDGCSSTYHQPCMDITEVPEGSWYCPYCICKFCGEMDDDLMNKCHQCGRKYHLKCYQGLEERELDLNMLSHALYCDQNCIEVSEKLEKTLVGLKNELEEGYSWTLLRQLDYQHGVYIDEDYERTICHSKLAVAWRLMEDFFGQVFDSYTKINVIKNVIYNCGSNFNRIDFKGFYTAVLETNGEIVCVAALRIHDKTIAEMPFITAHSAHRRKGMCRKLMIAIESVLCYLDIEKLIIPSAPEKTETAKAAYGACLFDRHGVFVAATNGPLLDCVYNSLLAQKGSTFLDQSLRCGGDTDGF
ncbi:PREDICTED: increased DNA methylation 1-like [Ipomoea nil]|uniref:increased DNA methylation 1-like n=1 Tax=Ipomoea nil TaxID=35883 RepID=UPI000900B1C7|nr:PREDICTED: increased DNA methylation 1-like [Ipomoea nil]